VPNPHYYDKAAVHWKKVVIDIITTPQAILNAMQTGQVDVAVIADEPTTALDVTVQAEILALLRDLRDRLGMAIILITHDWGVLADASDRVVVMYAGQVVEEAALDDLYAAPRHPYTEGLLAANPRRATVGEPLPVIPGGVPAPADGRLTRCIQAGLVGSR
jgi:ABC-type dipeptide/oligopeptide/nickel transport system ATPase component